MVVGRHKKRKKIVTPHLSDLGKKKGQEMSGACGEDNDRYRRKGGKPPKKKNSDP